MAFIRPRIRPRTCAIVVALLVALTVVPQAPRAQAPRACTVRVTLLQVNDVYRFTPGPHGGGLARVSTLRKRIM
jgi:2',3'-cyclic-nucleotide 2'-phosphodiesterase (5'-nucleotidase family)